MELPNRDRATVPERKITHYLLSDTHPRGRGKAAFFQRYGFAPERPPELADALLDHAVHHPVARVEPSPVGLRYIIEGKLRCPDGRSPLVRSIWFIHNDEEIPRLASAYPLRRRS